MRFLMGGGDEGGSEDNHDDTLQLRIAAIFIILAGSLIGSLPPLISARMRTPSAIVNGVLRAFAGGVILALALVHIVPESVAKFESIAEYPLAGILILGGIFIMIITENGLHALYHHDDHTHGHSHIHVHDPAVGQVKDGDEPPKHNGSVSKVTAWMMEMGCVFHSVIIGVELGISTMGYSKIVGLIVALLFHQLIEGISLASVVAAAGFSFPKSLSMVIIYSLTTPLGIAAGIGVADTYDSESRTATIVQGSLDGIAAGLLLYIGFVHLVCPDFCSGARMTWKHRISSFVSLLFGGGFMAMLAIWA